MSASIEHRTSIDGQPQKLADIQNWAQVNTLYKGWRISSFTHLFCILLVAYGVRAEYDNSDLGLWLVTGVCTQVLRAVHMSRFKEDELTNDNYRRWFKLNLFWSFVTALNWVLAAHLFIHAGIPNYTIAFAGIFICALAVSVLSYSPSLITYLTYAVPVSLALVIYSIVRDTEFSSSFIIIIPVLALLSVFSWNIERSHRKQTRLAYKNATLVVELIQQKEAAERAVHAKDQFLAAASHDMRQPLHASGLFLEALQSLDLGDEAVAIVERLSQSNNALNGLLHGLLDISRLDANVVEYQPENTSLEPILKRTFQQYEKVFNSPTRSISLTAEPELFVYSDPLLLERILRNIVDNAVKFTDQGAISIDAKKSDSSLIELTISDTGKGIPKEEHQNVFSEFSQLNNPERDREKGLGLGLAIVQRLCDLMSIEIKMESELNQGTKFSILVPLGNKVDAKQDLSTDAISVAGSSILVIDDEVDILDGMSHTLRISDAKVITAASADEAIEKLHRQDVQPDAIIADYRLRDNKNGVDAIKQIRDEFNTEIPAALVTGDTSPDRILQVESGNIPIIYKPVSAQKLKQTIMTLLD